MIDESRLIPATADLIEGWIGPGLAKIGDDSTFSRLVRLDVGAEEMQSDPELVAHIALDPERPEVRDRLLRVWRSSTGERMPEWARDVPGAVWWMAMAGRVLYFCRPPWTLAAVVHDVALLDSDGTLTLPPIVAGGEVVRWPA